MKKIVKILDLLISIALGFFLNYVFTSEFIVAFFEGLGSVYVIVAYIALIIQIVGIFIIIQLIRTNNIHKRTYKILLLLYFVILIFLLFGRRESEYSINFNILYLFNRDCIMQNIMNVVFFIPIGYLMYSKDLKSKKAICISIIGVILIECIQLVFHLGIFDICDIVLNISGILSGYYISKKKNIKIL